MVKNGQKTANEEKLKTAVKPTAKAGAKTGTKTTTKTQNNVLAKETPKAQVKRSRAAVKPNYALEARKHMKVLGVYKEEFEPVIKIYGQLRYQYDQLTERFEKSGFDYSEDTAQGSKKHPIVTTLESLRKDILSYASQLGLTPAGLKKINESSMQPKRISPLAESLRKLSNSA